MMKTYQNHERIFEKSIGRGQEENEEFGDKSGNDVYESLTSKEKFKDWKNKKISK